MSNFFEFKAEDTRCEVHSMEKYRGKRQHSVVLHRSMMICRICMKNIRKRD